MLHDAFLLAVPVVVLGRPELSASYMGWIVAAYLLAWRAPPRLRPWLVPLALGNVAFWDYVIQGFTEGSMVFLLLATWIRRRRAVVSAVLMGAAVTAHQEACWPFALFYLVWSGCPNGWPAAARRLAVIAAMLGLVNDPFALRSPGDRVNGVLGPLKDPMLLAGLGIIALGTTGRLPLWPGPVYIALELAALVACLVYYARTCRRQPDTGLVLALVPLLLAWRASFVYFFAPLPVLGLWQFLSSVACTPREPSRGDGLESGAKARDVGGHSSAMLLATGAIHPPGRWCRAAPPG